MNTTLLKMECLTDLHVDSGESNYNIIDNEVQKDLNGNPTVHSSGIKGAMREYFSEHLDDDNDDNIKRIFGEPSTKDVAGGGGKYKFLTQNSLRVRFGLQVLFIRVCLLRPFPR